MAGSIYDDADALMHPDRSSSPSVVFDASTVIARAEKAGASVARRQLSDFPQALARLSATDRAFVQAHLAAGRPATIVYFDPRTNEQVKAAFVPLVAATGGARPPLATETARAYNVTHQERPAIEGRSVTSDLQRAKRAMEANALARGSQLSRALSDIGRRARPVGGR